MNKKVASLERTHIGFFGLRNAGKSSIVNAITNQNLSIVSHLPGTTTDPVKKVMELFPLGPVIIYDTPGIDDEGEIGSKRILKSKEILRKVDIAILVVDCIKGLQELDKMLISEFQNRNLPYIIAMNKSDLCNAYDIEMTFDKNIDSKVILCSAKTSHSINQLRDQIAKLKIETEEKSIIKSFVKPGDSVVLVIPIDKSAPKGRLILPQQQVIRELLEVNVISSITSLQQLENTIESLKMTPNLVITDSQIFKEVSNILDRSIPLTSFSILLANYKGNLETLLKGAYKLDSIKKKKILISEGCTHHRQCDDIGTVKIPNLVRKYTRIEDIEFEYTQGGDFPENLTEYDLIIHCGGCMLNQREFTYRMQIANEQNIDFTNFGMAIAHMNQILERATELFGICREEEYV